MKKKCLLIASFFALMLYGCGTGNVTDNQSEKSMTEESVQESESSVTNTQQETDGTENENPTEIKAEKSYYDKWTIDSKAGTAVTYAMSEEEINDLIGDTIEYMAGACYYNGNEIELNGYEEETYPVKSFWNDFQVDPLKLGIKENEVLAVSVLQEGNFIGNSFYIIDQDTLLLYHEGVFFKAVRE